MPPPTPEPDLPAVPTTPPPFPKPILPAAPPAPARALLPSMLLLSHEMVPLKTNNPPPEPTPPRPPIPPLPPGPKTREFDKL